MSHEILGQRFIGRVRPAWHELGTIFPENEKLSAEEAVKRVAGDIQVVTVPLYFDLEVNGKTQQYEAKDEVEVVRMPTHDDPMPKTFGAVTKSWKPDSYTELGRVLNKLSETYRVETAGLLKDGSLCFLSFKAPSWDVKGDPMESYLTANFSMVPGQAHRMFESDVRVVCWNTNTSAQSSASILLHIHHGMDAKQQMALAADLIIKFREAQNKTKELCEAFASKSCSVEQAAKIFKAAYPDPELPAKVRQFRNACGSAEAYETWKKSTDPQMQLTIAEAEERFEQLMQRQVKLRDTARTQFDKFLPNNLRGTVWAAYNAATEVSDWREGRGAAESCLYGTRAAEKGRAFAEAVKVIEAN
ncbi:MAG: DUF932 domain-containing protein [Elusimicrobia bacterium]|nr:DUF932 domain-containing protein [Elusimicrobiota bacterium]